LAGWPPGTWIPGLIPKGSGVSGLGLDFAIGTGIGACTGAGAEGVRGGLAGAGAASIAPVVEAKRSGMVSSMKTFLLGTGLPFLAMNSGTTTFSGMARPVSFWTLVRGALKAGCIQCLIWLQVNSSRPCLRPWSTSFSGNTTLYSSKSNNTNSWHNASGQPEMSEINDTLNDCVSAGSAATGFAPPRVRGGMAGETGDGPGATGGNVAVG